MRSDNVASNTPTQIGFDYTHLAPDVRAEVETATRRLHDLESRTSESIIEMGNQLITVKEKLGHGEFLVWLDLEFGWSDRIARHLMTVADRFKLENFSNLETISPSALYVLAADSTPEEVRIEFTELAKIGRAVRHKDVKEAVAKAKTRTKAEPIPVQEWESGDDDYPEVPYEVVDLSSGEILDEQGQFVEEEAERVAIGIVRANGDSFARKIANAILGMTAA